MNKFLSIFRCFVFVICGLVLFTQNAAADFGSEAIYVVDMQRVVTESARGKTAKANLENDLKKQKQEIQAQVDALKKQREALQSQAAVLSKSALNDKVESIKKKEFELRELMAKKSEELVRRQNSLVEQIVNEASVVIKEICKKNNYRFVIEHGQAFVVYMDEGLDLTDDVIDGLDDRD